MPYWHKKRRIYAIIKKQATLGSASNIFLFTSFFALGEIKASAAAVGDTFTVQGDAQELVYKITSADTVDVIKSNKSDLSGVFTLGATVENEGVTYKITEIGNAAFKATHLTKIDLSKASNLTRIGVYSFGNVFGVTEAMGYDTVILPEGVTYIANGAFSGNTAGSSLTTINIPSTVETVGAYAFAFNPNLKTLDFRNCDNLKIMGPCIFLETPLDTLYLPEGLMDINCGDLDDGYTWFGNVSDEKTSAEEYQTEIYTTASYGQDDMISPLIDSSWINELARVNTNVKLIQKPFLYFTKGIGITDSGWEDSLVKVVWRNQNVFAEATVFSNVYSSGDTSAHMDQDIVFFIDGVKKTPTFVSDFPYFYKNTPCYLFRNMTEGIHTIKAVNSGGIETESTLKVDYPTISFDSGGGTNVEPLQYSFEDFKEYEDFDTSKCPVNPQQIPVAPTKKGYTFKRWYKGSDANEYDFEAYRLSDGDITLKAKWDANTYKVTFVDWENKEIASSTVEYEKSATAPAPPARDGYTFKG